MPLTRISLGTAWRPAEFAQLSALFHECLVAEFDVPSADRFQFIERAADEQRIYDPHYLSEGRSARFVLFHIFAGKPRSRAQKQGLYRRLCARLDDEMAVSPQDVMVVIQFNQLETGVLAQGRWRMNETGGAARGAAFQHYIICYHAQQRSFHESRYMMFPSVYIQVIVS